MPKVSESDPYFHGGKPGSIVIRDNYFDTFDAPLLYAKSVNGLVFKKNKKRTNTEYKPYHWNQKVIWLEHCTQTEVEEP